MNKKANSKDNEFEFRFGKVRFLVLQEYNRCSGEMGCGFGK